MQSLILPPTSFTSTQFGHPRFHPASERLALNYPLPTNARLCNPRDLLPLRPMSSSVPAEDPPETPENVRLPSQVEGTAVSTASVTAPTVAISAVSETAHASGPSVAAIAHNAAFQQRVVPTTGGEILPPFTSDSVHEQRTPHHTSTFPPSAFRTSPTGAASRALPPRGTRRTKPHVASACVNCKKKHLGCDTARPCRRCVLSGKEATCVDVTHKKRGRPPLKAEDASLRSYASQTVSATTSAEQQTALPGWTHSHRPTGSREIRPVTDLQLPNAPHGAAAHPPRWSTSVFPQVVDPMHAHMGHRRFSSSGSISQMTVASSPSFLPLAGFNPVFDPGRTPGRPLSSYANQALPPTTSPPQYQQPFSVPISPYTGSPRMGRFPGGDPLPVVAPPRDPRETYPESPVRLPPIFPPTTHSRPPPQGHRLSDPYPATWSSRLREEMTQQQQQGRQVASSPRGFMESISPTSQMRRPPTDDPLWQQASQPSVTRHDEQPSPDHETGSRPTKRRKMALDDMVND